jgi:hypothetical protein
MGLGDRIRAFFAKKNNPELGVLQRFLDQHQGVEGYIEPKTATNPTTLLLVDRDGRHERAPVREPEDAIAFCERRGIPVYDLNVVGYPQRMRDFQRGKRPASSVDDEVLADLERRLHETDPDTPNN